MGPALYSDMENIVMFPQPNHQSNKNSAVVYGKKGPK